MFLIALLLVTLVNGALVAQSRNPPYEQKLTLQTNSEHHLYCQAHNRIYVLHDSSGKVTVMDQSGTIQRLIEGNDSLSCFEGFHTDELIKQEHKLYYFINDYVTTSPQLFRLDLTQTNPKWRTKANSVQSKDFGNLLHQEHVISPNSQKALLGIHATGYNEIGFLSFLFGGPRRVLGVFEIDPKAFQKGRLVTNFTGTKLGAMPNRLKKNYDLKFSFEKFAAAADWKHKRVFVGSHVTPNIQVWSLEGDSLFAFGDTGRHIAPPHLPDSNLYKSLGWYIHHRLESDLYRQLWADTANNRVLRIYRKGVPDTIEPNMAFRAKKGCNLPATEADQRKGEICQHKKPTFLQVYTPQGQLKADFQVPPGSKVVYSAPGEVWLAQEPAPEEDRLEFFKYTYPLGQAEQGRAHR
jgi:hypothetical protein